MKYIMEDFNGGNLARLVAAIDVLGKALPYTGGTHELGDIGDMVADGSLQLWAGEASAALTELQEFPRMSVCHIFLAAGEKEELHDILEEIEAWAWTRGCSRITITGRKGWVRDLADRGFTESAVHLAKEIEP